MAARSALESTGDDPKKEMIARARALADQPATPVESPKDHGKESDAVPTRCPSCHNQVAVDHDTPWSHITCPSCQSIFSLIDHEDVDFVPGAGRLGQFELLHRLGAGGFGSVWQARDVQLDRLVAIKVPHDRHLTAAEASLFLREARAAAQLQHPNIVGIYEVGRDRDTVFIVYELIAGVSLADWSERGRLSFRETAMFCLDVAEALDFAHRHGIIHRDLKPANILVRTAGETAAKNPAITDFGLAKRNLAEWTVTLDGQIVGTPSYMSPEQARGEFDNVDERTDIYSLGVILFELLTGVLPFRGTAPMILEQVLRDDPPSPRRLNIAIPRDLETIALKAMRREPAARYASARAVANDLRRYLQGLPITARPIRWPARSWRWCRRQPLAALLVFLVAAIAVVAPVVAFRQAALARRESTARAHAVLSDRQARQMAYAFGMNSVQQSIAENNFSRANSILRSYLTSTLADDLRSFPWYLWWRAVHVGLEQRWNCLQRPIELACDESGKYLAFCGSPESIVVWNLAQGRWQSTLRIEDNTAQAIAISRDGSTLAIAGNKLIDGEAPIWIFDAASGNLLMRMNGHSMQVRGLAFTPNGRQVASASYDGTIKIWDWESGECRQTFTGHAGTVYCVRFSSDGEYLFSGGGADIPSGDHVANELIAWNVSDGSIVARKTHFAVSITCLALSADDQMIVAAGTVKAPLVLKTENLEPVVELQPTTGMIHSVAMAGDRIWGAGSQGLIWCWDVRQGHLIKTYPGHDDLVFAIATSADARHVFSAAADSTIAMWDAVYSVEPHSNRCGFGECCGSIVQTPLVRPQMCFVGLELTVHSNQFFIADAENERRLFEFPSDSATVFPLESTRGEAVIVDQDRSVHCWSNGTQTPIRLNTESKIALSRAAVSADGSMLALGTGTARNTREDPVSVYLYDRAARRQTHELLGHGRVISAMTFSPDGKWLAVASGDRRVCIWDTRSGELVRAFTELFDKSMLFFTELRFSPRGDVLLGCNRLGEVCFWNTADWSYEFRVQRGFDARALAFSPDGRIAAVTMSRRVDDATGQQNAEVALWDVATRELTARLTASPTPLVAIAFSSDGSQLCGLDDAGQLWRWRAATPDEVSSLLMNEIMVPR